MKPLSFIYLILSTMQLVMGSPSLSTSVLHSTPLTTLYFSIISFPISASWVPPTTGLSSISQTGLFQSLLATLPLSYYLHLVVFPKGTPVLGPILFTIHVSPIASIESSHGINQQQYADDTQRIGYICSSGSLRQATWCHF